ncbi:hypothetical protein Tco_1474318 [Tanacetum coccineum]
MIQVKEMMQDNDLKNSKSKDKGSKSRSQSMDEQSHYKQDKTITRQSINVERHIFNVIGGTGEFEERDLNIGGDNEKFHKENEHLKQIYKDLYDSIKKTRVQTKDHNDSLISQINSKTVENADLKAQIQEKVFAHVALKNELRKLKGNTVDTKFAKPSILGKPVLQPPKNQSVVRQPNAFKSERPNFSKSRFASQVDVNNILSKPVIHHYLPKVRKYVLAKPHHVITTSSSRNSSKESYGSNNMAYNYYLEEAKKKTQDKNMNLKPSVMHTTSLQNTTNGSKPKPRSNNQTSRSLPVSKSSCGMSNSVPLVDHSRNSSSFLDSKQFVCSTCQNCIFNANHDACLTKFLKEVNSRIKSSAVHEKPNTLSSCLKWKLTGKIFKIVGLRWIPTRKRFTDSTTKVDNEPPNGSNEDITNPYECEQTLNVNLVSQCVSNGYMAFEQFSLGPRLHSLTPRYISSELVQNPVSTTPYVPPSTKDYEILFQPLFDEHFNPPPHAISLDPVAYFTNNTSEQLSSIIPQGVEDDFHDIEVAYMDNDPYFGIPIPEPSSEETTLQGVIPSNLHHLNQSFDTLTKLKKKHPLENVIGDPSRPVSTRSQLQEHAIQCYFDANDNPISFGGKWSG